MIKDMTLNQVLQSHGLSLLFIAIWFPALIMYFKIQEFRQAKRFKKELEKFDEK